MANIVVSIYLFLILVVLPFFSTDGFVTIGTDKANFFQYASMIAGVTMIPVFAVLLYRKLVYAKKVGAEVFSFKKWNPQFSSTDVFAMLYMVSLMLSFIFSKYREYTIWGAKGWFMGLLPHSFLLLAYFIISRLWKPGKWMFLSILPVSFIVSILGYLDSFSVNLLPMKSRIPQFISTIGNINWFCGYIVTVFFAGVYLFWQYTGPMTLKKFLLSVYILVGFGTIIIQGSSSGILTLGVMLFVFFVCSAKDGERMENFIFLIFLLSIAMTVSCVIRIIWPDRLVLDEQFTKLLTNKAVALPFLLFAVLAFAACQIANRKRVYPHRFMGFLSKVVMITVVTCVVGYIVILAVNTCFPGFLTIASDNEWLTFSPLWGSRRGGTWIAGARTFSEQDLLHKIVGVGPDAMVEFLYNDASASLQGMLQECFSWAKLTNCHNEWLNVLVNEGLLGAVAYIGMIVSAIKRFCLNEKVKLVSERAIMIACGFCILAYTVNNVVSFKQSMNFPTMMVLLGMAEACYRKDNVK